MRQNGRKSGAGLEVVEGDFGKRPEPGEDMAPEEAEIWRRCTATEPLEFFATGATRDLLKAYCRHQATTDKLTEVINLFKPEWLKNAEGVGRFNALCRMRDREARGASEKAMRLRMTNQARYTTQRAGNEASKVKRGLKPWEA